MEVLDCKKVSDKIRGKVNENLANINKVLGIAIISIGDNEVNSVYLRKKRNFFRELGVEFREFILDSDVEEKYVLDIIDHLNKDDLVDGIMIELPIKSNIIDTKKILNRIDYRKDVDGLTDINRIRLKNNEDCIISSTVVGIMEIFNYYDIDLDDKRIVIVGNGYLVGQPLADVLLNNKLDVVVCDSKTENINEIIKKADILVSCVGVKNLIKLDSNFNKNIIIIDAGVSIVDGEVVGDVMRDKIKNINGFITPIIGGVGIVTTASLASNLVKCYRSSNDKI